MIEKCDDSGVGYERVRIPFLTFVDIVVLLFVFIRIERSFKEFEDTLSLKKLFHKFKHIL